MGLFGIHDDFTEKYQSLDERFIKNKASTFFFKASGKAMSPLILPDDILIVDRSIEQVDGRVAIVAFEGELLCKRIFRFRNGVILRSHNPDYQDIRVPNEMEAAVWGIVVATAREIQ